MDTDLLESSKTTVICSDVPVELLLKKPANEYFSTFGTIRKLTIRPKSQACIVFYEHPEEAAALIESGAEYEGQQFIVDYHVVKKKRANDRNIAKKDPDPDWNLDPEVRAELAAMGELTQVRTYNIRQEKMVVESEMIKREPIKRERKTKMAKETAKTLKSSIKSDLQTSKEQKDYLKIMSLPCYNMETKLRSLESRDKFIRLKLKQSFDLRRSTATVGTCPDMCPEKERVMREVQHQVAFYEQQLDSKCMDQRLAVKQYSRSSADQEAPLPHELRNVAVLQMTMAYLMHRIIPLCDNPEINLGDWYHFLWDRTRSIRKDITQQELCSLGSVELVEQCARFHVHCSARLVAEDPSVFDQKINTENLTKCLQTLKYMYHDLRVKDGQVCPNEAEFRAYVILLNLNDGNFMWEVQQLSSEIQKSPSVQFALQIYSALDKNNFIKFFKLLHLTTYLNSCILLRYFNQVRIRALRTILKCYSPRSPHSYFPIAELQSILAFEGIASARYFLEYHSLMLSDDRQYVLLNRHMFQMPDVPYALDRATNVIESKRSECLGTVICGKELPEPLFEHHIPLDSFKGDYLDYSDFKESLVNDLDVTDDVGSVKPALSTFLKVHNVDSRSNSPINLTGNEGTTSIFGGSMFSLSNQQKLDELSRHQELKRQQEEYKYKQLELEREQLWHKQVELKMQKDLEMQQKLEKARKSALEIEKQKAQLEAARLEELKSLESQRERVLELLKIEEEERELKEQRRIKEIQHQKEAKKQQQIKKQEQLRLKLMAQQEQRRKDVQMQQDVRELLTDLVRSVQNNLNNERLKDIKAGLVDYKMSLFIQKWRLRTVRNKRKRKSMDLQPQYIQHRNIEDEAKELRTNSQDLTLSLIKRYKYGHALNLSIEDDFLVPILDIANLVGDILVNKKCNTFLESEIYWKIAFSLPDKCEMSVGLDRITNVLDSLLKFTSEGYTLTACHHNNISFNYCIEKEPKMCASDNDGLIFIGDIVDSKFYNRVFQAVKDLRVNSKVSVAVILQRESKNDSQLRNLLNKSCADNTKITYKEFTRNNISDEFKQAVVFLANTVQKRPAIELDLLSNFIRNNLVYELWNRVQNLSNWNANYKKCFCKPNVVIKIHNEAVDRLKNVIFTISSLSFGDFPCIFKKYFIHDKPIYPCDYKYFPNCWRDTKYKRLVYEALDAFKLPEFNFKWPPEDEVELEKTITKYLCFAFDFAQTEKTFFKVMAVILKYVQDSFVNIQNVVWSEVIQVIVLEKLKEYVDFTFEECDSKFINQLFVVYETRDLKQFLKSPWFYLNNSIIKSALKTCTISEATYDDFESDLSEDGEEINDTLNNINKKLKAKEDKLDKEDKLGSLKATMKDLEITSNIQRRISYLIESNLRNALN